MPRKVSCETAKKINSTIQQKIKGAIKDMKKDQPRSASSKLYAASTLINKETRGVWKPNESLQIGNDASYVSFQLLKPSMMYWPKWRERAENMLKAVDRIAERTKNRCP